MYLRPISINFHLVVSLEMGENAPPLRLTSFQRDKYTFLPYLCISQTATLRSLVAQRDCKADIFQSPLSWLSGVSGVSGKLHKDPEVPLLNV